MSIEEGAEITVTGTVSAEELVIAPLTGQPCVLHRTHARVWDRLDAAANLVDEVLLVRHAPFVLEADGQAFHITGTMAIAVDIRPVDVWPHPAHAAALLAGYAPFVRSTFFDHVVVHPGERLTVTGVVAREMASDGEHGYRETGIVTRLVGYDGRPLRISR